YPQQVRVETGGRSAAVVGDGVGGGPGGEEVALVDLADVVGGQGFGAQPPGGGDLEVGEVPGGEGAQLGHGHRAVGGHHHGGGHDLAEVGVRPTTDSNLLNLGVLEEHVLHVGGGDVLAAPDDEVLQPAGDEQVAVGVEVAEVAGVDPAVLVDRPV